MMETPGEILARQIEAECYDLAALPHEVTLPVPDPPKPEASPLCSHARDITRLGRMYCLDCGRML